MAQISRIYPSGTSPAQDAFLLRMHAQCEQIRQYQLAVRRDEGRWLSMDQAAIEWIERYAAMFDPRDPNS